MRFFKELTLFQKIFFLFFSISSLIIFLLPLILNKNDFKSVLSPLSILGLISIFCGILVSIYTAKARPIAYVWWWGSTLIMAIICFCNGLYGQFIQNLFFSLPIQIYGFFAWRKNLAKESSLEVLRLKSKQWGVLIFVILVFWIGYGLLLKYLPDFLSHIFNVHMKEDPQILLDSFTAMMAIVAAILTDLRFIEQWYFWIIYNGVAVITFIVQILHTDYSGNIPMLIASLSNTLNLTQYIVGVIYGYLLWRKMLNTKKC